MALLPNCLAGEPCGHRPSPFPGDGRRRSILFRSTAIAILTACLYLVGLTLLQPDAQAGESPIRIARIGGIPDQYVGGEILRLAYARAHIPLEFVDLPAMRALAESSSGNLDGEVHRILDVANEYPTLVPVKPAINFIEPSAFVRTGEASGFKIDGWQSVREYNVAIVTGVGSSERGTAGFPNVTRCTTLNQALMMLAEDRVDVVATDLFSGKDNVLALGLSDKITPLAPPLQVIEIYHFLNRKHANLVPRLEAVLRDMAASGELARLRADLIRRYLEQGGPPGSGSERTKAAPGSRP